ncbi:SPOR domain-containing protein [Sphingobium algorifonticola]|uniref:SPOR domain-containing protein n=2 Tax=Sphingobium algorifonticola TaxID=2008318 RepID=A0A437JA93_9SPHN|nr:SPOR domain-containing protein [Sphingobium algorifonticola]
MASALTVPVHAQSRDQAAPESGPASSPGFSQLDVRPPDAASSLNASLTRLGQNPRDVSALIGAGEAALALDDPRAATGFFARADEIQSGNGRIKAGLGRAMLQLQNPAEALRLFDQASRLRYPADSYIADRALAYDLTGDQTRAQQDYQTALRATPDDPELLRRYAVSLGISGQVESSERLIAPLLYKNDRAAWRNRAFVLAMNGREADARDITQKVMPKPLADAIEPYMMRMAALTPAQRAAAVHFGNFPSNAGVRMAANAATQPSARAPTVPPAAVTPQRSVPQPRTDRTTGGRRAELPSQRATAAVPAASVASSQSGPTNPGPTYPAPVSPAPVNPAPVNPAPVRVVAATASPTPAPIAPSATPQPTIPQVQGPVDPARSGSVVLAQATTVRPADPAPPTAAQPDPVATRTLADIMRELDVPDAEKAGSAEAVDLAEILAIQEEKRAAARTAADKAKRDAAAKAKAEADAKAKALAAEKAKLARNPSRNWVQIGTGQSISALGFTLRGLRKKHDSIAAKDAYTAAWGRTNRLVVGPFPSFDKAKAFEASLKKAGADAFAWRSDAGEEVSAIAAK